MRTALALIALLSACETAPPLEEALDLPEDAVAAPAAFSLTAPNAIAGVPLVLTVTGAPAGASVRFAVSSLGLGAGPCPPILAGQCLGIRSPANQLTAPVVANALGTATFTYNVAQPLAGSFLSAQAMVVTGGVKLSNAVDRKVAAAGTNISPTVDTDGNGYTVANGDCAEFDATISPDIADTVGDYHDQNCDDLDGIDDDQDQVASIPSGGADCDDTTPFTYPGAPEQCDAQDNDCDGALPPTMVWPSPGGPWIGGARDTFAVHYTVTSRTWVDRLRFRGRAYAANWGEVLRVYDSAGPGQQYTLAATYGQAGMEGRAAGYNWFFHDLNMVLETGHRYIFEIEGTSNLRVFTSNAASPTVTYPWGALNASWASVNILPASFNAAPPNSNSVYLQLVSWYEVDQDGDGLMACLDCDDANPADIVCTP